MFKILKRAARYIVYGTPQNNIKKVYPQVRICQLTNILKGRTAIITGGTSGIGLAIAKAFVNAGATVVITGRNKQRIEKACENIRTSFPNCDIYGIELDNTKIQEFGQKFQEVCKIINGKSIDILVNNAGLRGGHISKATEEEYDNIMDTNAKGTFFMSQLVAKYMVANNIRGNILNITSASSVRPALSAYHMSKWAIRGLTQGMARALAPYGICVNAIAPGPTATPMLLGDKDNCEIFHERNLLGRYAMPEEIANMAVILVSDMSRTIIGDTIFMSGGGGIITNEDVNFNFQI